MHIKFIKNHNKKKINKNKNKDYKNLLFAFIITLSFMFIEAIGGFLSGSLALLADSGHMFIDSISLLLSLLALKFSKYKPNNIHTFGYHRLTTLAASFNSIALLIITIMVLLESIYRFFTPFIISSSIMVFVAFIGLITNSLSLWFINKKIKEKDINIRAAIMHVIGDLIGSIGTILAAIIIFYTSWVQIDSLLSIFISFFMLINSWKLLSESSHELLEGASKKQNINFIKEQIIKNIIEVRDVHHVHLWMIGNYQLITLHIKVSNINNSDFLLKHVQKYLYENHNINHSTIQIEINGCNEDICKINYIKPYFNIHNH